ncbi:MAG: universal stress protein [Dysgonamonadaceae bacterium]|jgi:nucleotide-binding universal stress UspA family protein|nr:universal stress protein [Dysgonamonadaceae bacterium]
MEDRLITLAIHTYQKAQIIKTLLESEGIEVCLHNVNLISPMISSGVRVRIKERDLPFALKLIENSTFLEADGKMPDQLAKKILIPVDFSDYSKRACEIGLNFAKKTQAEAIIMYVHFTPFTPPAISLNDNFPNSPLVSSEEIAALLLKARNDWKDFTDFIHSKIQNKEWADVLFSSVFCEGLPEEEIVSYCNKYNVGLIIMGTRGRNQKDVDLIGSVTAEVIEMTKTPVFAIPEDTPFCNFSDIKRIAFGTSFDQTDLLSFDRLYKMFQSYEVEYYLFHITHKQSVENENKLAQIKEYFDRQYPAIKVKYAVLDAQDFILNLEKFLRDKQIDIISIPTHKRNLFARMFNPSISRKMLFHTNTPLLTIRS